MPQQTENECRAVRNQHVLRNKTANTIADENKFLDPGGDRFLYERGLECARRAVSLSFTGLEVMSYGVFPWYDLEIISAPLTKFNFFRVAGQV